MRKLHDVDDYHGMTPRDTRDTFHHRVTFTEEQDLGAAINGFIILLAVIAAFVFLALYPPVAHAGSPILIDRKTGKYLGNLNNNPLDPNSVSNPLGRYGSPLSPDSINNRLGRYGSPLSNDSANNPFAGNPPAIVSPGEYGYGEGESE